jgi:hypothetical protein
MFGGPQLRPHLVEFIRGAGVRVNGVVVQDAGGTGPFVWTVPDDVAFLDDVWAVGGGQAGSAGGQDSGGMTSLGGGQGGACAGSRVAARLAVLPGSSITVTIGAKGVGTSTPSTTAAAGGDTRISGLLPGASLHNDGTELRCGGAVRFYSPIAGASNGAATSGGGVATAGNAGADTARNNGVDEGYAGKWVQPSDPGTGGGGNASGAVAGANGGRSFFGFNQTNAIADADSTELSAGGTGNTTGTISRGGGGGGAFTPFGRGGNGGNGGANGGHAVGYGAGGGGGGGGGAGGDGGDGYVRFIVWSAR